MTGSAPAPRQAAAAAAVAALQSALAAEQAAVYGYGVAGAYLTGGGQAAATADWLAHQEARDALEAMLRSRGAQPAPAAVAYQLPIQVRTSSDAVALATTIEDRMAAVYLGLVAVTAPDVRQFGARQVQASALRAAAWRGSTVAFPGLTAAELSH
jgi:Domain of unknown function (DUF4439)